MGKCRKGVCGVCRSLQRNPEDNSCNLQNHHMGEAFRRNPTDNPLCGFQLPLVSKKICEKPFEYCDPLWAFSFCEKSIRQHLQYIDHNAEVPEFPDRWVFSSHHIASAISFSKQQLFDYEAPMVLEFFSVHFHPFVPSHRMSQTLLKKFLS
jgi:hypothetical protein